MSQLHEISARDRRKRERRVWRNGLLVSLLLHLAIFMGWRGNVIPQSPFAAAGPRAGADRAAAGSLQALNISSPETRPIIPPPRPLEVAIEVEPVEFDDEARVDPAAVAGIDPGGPEGPGLPDGTGQGDAGNAAEGLNQLQPAAPRGMIIPPRNRDLRGTEVQVWVFVDEQGRVVPDSTRLDPPTRDRSFNRRLIEEAAEWVFRPARKGGEAVASWFPYTIFM
ncbi:MAG: hypothetical protein R3253_03555 [Longimicrobiales bacterium]|nr:hypothetical protein [Longimicrobiales bacterium]